MAEAINVKLSTQLEGEKVAINPETTADQVLYGETTVQAKLDEVATVAEAAQAAAKAAQTAAGEAQTTADAAQTAAGEAQTAAGTAQTTAEAARDAAAAALPLTGGTLTGPLILAGEPADDNGAATKAYVDAVKTMAEAAQAIAEAAQTAVANSLFGTVTAIEAADIDVSLGSAFTKTISEAVTFNISGVPDGKAAVFTLVLTNGGENVTWPASVKWSGGTVPTLAADGVDVLTFFTVDGGITWYGVHSVQGAA